MGLYYYHIMLDFREKNSVFEGIFWALLFGKYFFGLFRNIQLRWSLSVGLSSPPPWILLSVKFETSDCNKLEDFFIKLFKFQIWWNKKTSIITSLRDFPSNFLRFLYSQIQKFDCQKPQRFSIKLFQFVYKWNLKSVTGNLWGLLQSNVMGDFTYIPTSLAGAHEIPLSYQIMNKIPSIAVLAHFS